MNLLAAIDLILDWTTTIRFPVSGKDMSDMRLQVLSVLETSMSIQRRQILCPSPVGYW
jgi:hypothetical protein